MKVDARALGIAAGNVAGIAFIACGLFFRIAPGLAGRSFDLMMHANMGSIWRSPGWGALVAGAVVWWVVTAACVSATVALYNRTVRS